MGTVRIWNSDWNENKFYLVKQQEVPMQKHFYFKKIHPELLVNKSKKKHTKWALEHSCKDLFKNELAPLVVSSVLIQFEALPRLV
jgi:hypothetical protein